MEYGSINCLDALYGLEFDYDPKFKTDVAIKNGLENSAADIDIENLRPDELEDIVNSGIENLIRDVDINFGKLLKEAIKVISNRNKTSSLDWDTAENVPSPYLDNFNKSIIRAKEKHQDVKSALNELRQSLEALLKHVVFMRNLKSKTQIDNLQIEHLLQIIRDAKLEIPKPIFTQIEVIQKQSTIGSHDQGSISHEQIFGTQAILGAIESLEKIKVELLKAS